MYEKRQHLLVVKRMIYLLECIIRIKFIMVVVKMNVGSPKGKYGLI